MKKLKCSRCKNEVNVSNDYNHKTCPKCRLYCQKYDAERNLTIERKIQLKHFTKQYRLKNKTKYANYMKGYFRRHKLELVKFMGGKCCHCDLKPEDVSYCMGVFVIDEIKPLGIGKKKFTNLSKKDLEYAKKLFLGKKTQLLCQNCSAIKSWKNGDYAHRNNS